jgi:predicted DNA-binding transcriptional regulator YafY
MLETSARLLRLLGLLQSQRFWSGAGLAERLEVTERTLRRDVARLRSLGYPVEATAGVAGGYQLGVGGSLPPLLLDDDEALAVALGLRSALTGSVAGIEDAAMRALSKLDPLLPPRLRRRVRALQSAVSAPSFAGPTVAADLLARVAGDCRDHHCLRFEYVDAQGRPSKRHVEPHGVVFMHPRWYLAAWDRVREDWRTFRIDRMAKPRTEAQRFVPRPLPDGDATRYVHRSVSSGGYDHHARVVLHAPLETLAARLPPQVGTLTQLGPDRCLFATASDCLHSLAVYIGLFGVDFEVQEPSALIEHLAALHQRIGRALEASATTPARDADPSNAAKITY